MCKDSINDYYIDKVSHEEIVARMLTIYKAFQRLRKHITPEFHDININEHILTNLVNSYFYDIERFKHFHSSARINKPKKSAYLIKWIVKYKPIWYRDSSYSDDPVVASILSGVNELFALRIGVGYAGIPQELIDIDLEEEFVYNLAHRPFCEGATTMWFETFMKLNKLPIE